MNERNKKRLPHIVVPVALLVLALLVSWFLVRSKPAAPTRRPSEPAVPVETILTEIAEGGMGTTVEGMGVVEPSRRIQLFAEVGGLVVWKNPDLTPGGILAEGAPLLRIDARNYEAVVAQQRAAVERARLELRTEEARRLVAAEEWQLAGGEGPEALRELALRVPQWRVAVENLAAAEEALRKAALDVERTTLHAPFDCVALDEYIDAGQVVTPQTRLAELAGATEAWIRVSLASSELAWLGASEAESGEGPPAIVFWDVGGGVARQGRVARVLPDVDPQGRTARVLVRLPGPFGAGGIPFGAYVRVAIEGRRANAIAIRASVLREGDRVWVKTPENRLEIRTVDVLRREKDMVLIAAGIEPGDRLVTSRIPIPIPGMLLRERGQTGGDGGGRAGGKP